MTAVGVLDLFDARIARAYRLQAARAALYAVGEGVSFGLTMQVLAALLDGDTDRAARRFAAVAVAVTATLAVHRWQTVCALRTTFAAINFLHHRMVGHLAELPVDWFGPGRAGSLNQLVWPGPVTVTRQILLNLAPLLRGVISPLIVLAFAASVDWRPAALMLVALPALWAVHRICARVLDEVERDDHQARAETTARILEFAQAQATLRTSRGEGLGQRLLVDALAAQDRVERARVGREMLARTAFGTLVSLVLAALVAVLGWRLIDDPSEAAVCVALLALVPRFAEPLRTVADLARTLRAASAHATRVADVLAAPALPRPTGPRLLPTETGRGLELRLSGVRFRYPQAAAGTSRRPDWALDGVDLTAGAGTTLALVGPSGAGKSTVLRLAARFGDPEAGSVTIGGVDVRDLGESDLYAAVGVVLQDIVLLSGTIRENVLLSRPSADRAALERAAALAGVDEIVARLPLGWETPVGNRGADLSGGERQRISLARVALQDPPLILLDEATAALDPVNEQVVGRWISAMSGRRTLVIVAHQLHTIVGADVIAVLDQGRVVERGSHADLLAREGVYTRMWRARTEASGWRLRSVVP